MSTDLGRDIKPYSDSLFREMCKRAYLCYRWHFRPDIKELMRRALRDESLPELYGLGYFLEAIEDDGRSQLEHRVSSIIGLFQGKEVLDYGCREGTLSNAIARVGSRVRCYDVDMSRFRMIEHENGVSVIAREELDSRIQAGQSFGVVFCCRVLCTVDDRDVDPILSDLRALVAGDGRVVIGVCNPFNLEATWALTHKKSAQGKYNGSFTYGKTIKSTGRTRLEHHRSINWYERRFLQAGLEVEHIDESPGLDVERLSPGSEVLFFTLKPVRRPSPTEVSLLVKASSMEWRTIDVQVRHIVGQLEGPERFLEKVVVTDRWAGPFARQYDASDQEAFFKKLGDLIEEGIIDRVLVLDGDQSPGINRRWFGLDSQASRSANGQPVHIALHGFEECRGEYILQLDSDCLIARRSRSDGYLERMVGLLKADEKVVTVSMPVPYDEVREFTAEGERGRWRTEVRCCLLARDRLLATLPLGNSVRDEALALPWHRALDGRMAELDLRSYRGGDPSTSFIHVPNDRKRNANEWFSIMEAIEGGRIPQCQLNQVDLVGDMSLWLPTREEELIFLLRGRNVPIPLLRRCLESLEHQSVKDWGLLIIDAGSDNGTAEFVKKVVSLRFPGRVTLLQNLQPLTPIENIDTAIRRLCSNPDSVIAMVDSDDALIGTDAASIIMEAYAGGADLTVGTMLRTDKHRRYPVDFVNPRASRGGNVWQHLRTFKKSLYDQVPADYLKLDGEWVRHTEDWAFMVPMVELSIKPVHINKPIYFYQPSADKAERSVADRERIIAGILEKASLREVGT
ncbi:MAG TPA: glycosyltransferase [Chloroflexota bacterium]|nr:glycosyltransferase [Chloroflexota bacterium]